MSIRRAAALCRIVFLCMPILAPLMAHAPLAQASVLLDPTAQARVRGATFEVVMKKPEQDSLSYERPLPLESLSYAERTDKYISIGTAFAIGANRFVTAAHVLGLGNATQYGTIALRGADGVVHEIDQIHKYSLRQDFGVFSLKSAPQVTALEVFREPKLDEPVFAVGNALGEGIVIRDGLLTSRTPEQRDGKWKWLRFSAAASPGNSGGPLLDKDGRVIGVVLRKSQNENLNYAVPIELIADAPDNAATVDEEWTYWLPVMDTKETGRRNTTFPLPKSYADLSADIMGFRQGFMRDLKGELRRKQSDAIFPRGAGSVQLLNTLYDTTGLNIIARGSDGTWQSFQPPELKPFQLPANGYVMVGLLSGTGIIKMRRPDDVAPEPFYRDSKLFMDTLLKVMGLKRPVGMEEVRIVSFGAAKQDTQYVDPYGRVWQLRRWDVEFKDSATLVLALPVPDGYVAMIQDVPTWRVEDAIDDMKTMAGLAYVSYAGTLDQWREYLRLTQYHPAALKDVRLDFDFGKSFTYRSKRFALEFDAKQQKIEPDSLLNLTFGYLETGGAVVWDVGGMVVMEKATGGPIVAVSRHARPAPSLPQEWASEWQKMIGREYPYDATAIESDGNTMITTVRTRTAQPAAPDAHVLYEIACIKIGKGSQEEMASALGRWSQGLNILED